MALRTGLLNSGGTIHGEIGSIHGDVHPGGLLGHGQEQTRAGVGTTGILAYGSAKRTVEKQQEEDDAAYDAAVIDAQKKYDAAYDAAYDKAVAAYEEWEATTGSAMRAEKDKWYGEGNNYLIPDQRNNSELRQLWADYYYNRGVTIEEYYQRQSELMYPEYYAARDEFIANL